VYLPASHIVHVDALAPLYVPAAHTTQLPLPGAGWCCPSSHASQYVAPADACFLPAAHALQYDTDVDNAASSADALPNRPATQSTHIPLFAVLHLPPGHGPLQPAVVDPPAPYLPAAQTKHAVLPVLFWYWPVGHATQCVELFVACPATPLLPFAHSVHAATPPVLYLPSAHVLHFSDWLCFSLNLAAGQSLHDDALAPLYLPPSHAAHTNAPAPLYCPAVQPTQADWAL